MNVIWCDTETTGIKPENSGAFEIAILPATAKLFVSAGFTSIL